MSNSSSVYMEVPMTLADVIERLKKIAGIPLARRRDLILAVNTTARFLHRNPSDIDADINALRKALDAIHPVQVGVSVKRIANVKSDLAAALHMTRLTVRIRRRQRPTSPEWKAFLTSIVVPWQRYALSRLARFCSTAAVGQDALSDEVMERFRRHLNNTQLAKDPDKIVKITRQTGMASFQGLKMCFQC